MSYSWYRKGTCTVTNGSDVVRFQNADITTAPNKPVVGDAFTIDGVILYEIIDIGADSAGEFIRLGKMYGQSTASNVAYALIRLASSTINAKLVAMASAAINQKQISLDDMYEWYTSTADTVDFLGPTGSVITIPTYHKLSNEIVTVGHNAANITKVADNIDDVKTVSENIAPVKAVSSDLPAINTINSNMTAIDALNANMSSIKNVDSNSEDITTVSKSIDDVKAVSENIDPVKNVDANMASVKDAVNQANKAKSEADRSSTEADKSKSEADRSKAEADKSAAMASKVFEIPKPDVLLSLNDSLVFTYGYAPRDRIFISGQPLELNTKSAYFSRNSIATGLDKFLGSRSYVVNEPIFEKDGILINGTSPGRDADKLSISSRNLPSDNWTLAILAKFIGSENEEYILGSGLSSNGIGLFSSKVNSNGLTLSFGGSKIELSGAWKDGDEVVILISKYGLNLDLTTKYGTITLKCSSEAIIGDLLYIGSDGNGSKQLNGNIKNLRVWFSKLNEGQISYIAGESNIPTVTNDYFIPLTSSLEILRGYSDGSKRKIGDANFSRNSSATYQGKIYGINEPRQDAARGTLISPQATNLFPPDSMWLRQTDVGLTTVKLDVPYNDLTLPITELTGTTSLDSLRCFVTTSISNVPVGTVRYVTVIYKRDITLTRFQDAANRGLSPAFNFIDGLPDLTSAIEGCQVVDYELLPDDYVLTRIKVTVTLQSSILLLGAYFAGAMPETYQMGIVQVSETLSEYIPTTSTEETQGADNLSVPSSLLGDGDWTIATTVYAPKKPMTGDIFAAGGGSGLRCGFHPNGNIELFSVSGGQIFIPWVASEKLKIVVTKVGNNVSIFVNGNQRSGTMTINISGVIEVGSLNNVNNINSFESDFRISQRAWSQGEIDAY